METLKFNTVNFLKKIKKDYCAPPSPILKDPYLATPATDSC